MSVGVFGVSVGLAALPVTHTAELFDGLVYGHIVRQHVVPDQELQFVTRRPLRNRHCRLTGGGRTFSLSIRITF